jgi:2-dehydro-3-deoxyphosphogalactonate aldolase
VLERYINKHPVIAILRGITPKDVVEISQCLYTHGIRVIEVPLNSPQAIKSIEKLVNTLPRDCLIGAGTVYNIEQVTQIENVGGKLIVSPHCDPTLIQYCQSKDLHVIAGVATPTEAVIAYQAGAKWLKLFPAQTYGLSHVEALKSVLPTDTYIIPVGGVSQHNALLWQSSGASALGIGNSLYQKNDSIDEVTAKVIDLNKALNIPPITN